MAKKKDIPQSEEGWGNVELPGLSDEELYSKNWNKVAANKERIFLPDWSLKQQERTKKRLKDPKWIKAIKKAGKVKSNNPEWVKAHAAWMIKKRIPVVTPKGIFDYVKDAKLNGIPSIRNFLRSKPDEYFYITQEGFARLKLITDPEEFQKQLLIEKQVYKDVKAAKKK